MNTPNEERDTTSNSAFNPFPEPQTIPSGWDLSEIICTPQSDSTMEDEDLRES
jgi:hypothetical protein